MAVAAGYLLVVQMTQFINITAPIIRVTQVTLALKVHFTRKMSFANRRTYVAKLPWRHERQLRHRIRHVIRHKFYFLSDAKQEYFKTNCILAKMARKTRSNPGYESEKEEPKAGDRYDTKSGAKKPKLVEKTKAKPVKRNLQEDLDSCEQQQNSKQSKKLRKTTKSMPKVDKNQSEIEHEYESDQNEVIVGSAKSLINSLKKRKSLVHEGHQSAQPSTSGRGKKVALNTETNRSAKVKKAKINDSQGSHSSQGKDESNSDGIDMAIGSSEDEFAEEEILSAKGGKGKKTKRTIGSRALSSQQSSSQSSEESEEEDPDLNKLDLPPRHIRNEFSSEEELDYEEFQGESSDQGSESESTNSDTNSSSESDELEKMRNDPKVQKLLTELITESRQNEKKAKRKERRREAELRREATHRKRHKARRSVDKGRKTQEIRERRRRSRSKRKTRSRSRESRGRRSRSRSRPNHSRSKYDEDYDEYRSSKNSGMRQKGISKGKRGKTINQIKSPSDTTIYAPALAKGTSVSPLLLQRIQNSHSTERSGKIGGQSPDIIDQISNFVENMRIRSEADRGTDHTPGRRRESPDDRLEEDPRALATEAIVEAEKFRANINTPKGNDNLNDSLKQIADSLAKLVGDSDDEFFHVTCHIENGLKQRIEKGEFVDLDKLLPKNRSQVVTDSSKRLQLMYKDGEAFLGAPESDNKINSIRKWDQAFRVYAAIYSQANPSRSAEIWQYVHVINTAAASYIWENVYYYDVTFRHLMHNKPKRSWAKTYNQLWNLAMCEPLIKNTPNNFGIQKFKKGDGNSFNKDDCCWRWNKGSCRKWNCKYQHRCSYWGAFAHIANACLKKKNSKSRPDQRSPNSPKKDKPQNKR